MTAGPRQGFCISKSQSYSAAWQPPSIYLWQPKGPGWLGLICAVSQCRAREKLHILSGEASLWKVQLGPVYASFSLTHKGLLAGQDSCGGRVVVLDHRILITNDRIGLFGCTCSENLYFEAIVLTHLSRTFSEKTSPLKSDLI